MKVTIKLVGFPDLSRAAGGKVIPLEFNGGAFGSLLEHLELTFGQVMRKALLDPSGALGNHVQVILNGDDRIPRHELSHPLEDGDHLMFVAMMSGG